MTKRVNCDHIDSITRSNVLLGPLESMSELALSFWNADFAIVLFFVLSNQQSFPYLFQKVQQPVNPNMQMMYPPSAYPVPQATMPYVPGQYFNQGRL